MILVLATTAIAYLLDALFVGCLWVVAAQRFHLPAATIRAGLLFLAFALLDLYWIPAVSAADVTFTIGNTGLANALGVNADTRATELFRVGVFDLLVWGVQTGLALAVIQAVPNERAV